MLTIDGFNLQDDDFIFYLNGIFNNEKQLFESDLYSDGSFIGYEKIKSKKPILNGYILDNIQENTIKLNRILYRRGPKRIEFSILDKEYVIMANVESGGLNNEGMMSFNLILQDPYLYALNPEVLSINETKGVGVKFPLRFPIRFEENQQLGKYITNIGTEIAYPVIRIFGPCRDFTIKNPTTDTGLSFIGFELVYNDVLVIDNRPKTRGIYVNGVNRPDLKNGNWIWCDIGNNDITFSRVSHSEETLCTIELQSRWI